MNSIRFTLELDSKIRLYHQLYEKISEQIKNGSFSPHSKLPSIRNVSTELNISKNTVTKAYEMLEKNHFIYSEQKRGYFVSDLKKIISQPDIQNTEETEEEEEEDLIPTVDSIIRQRLKTLDEPKQVIAPTTSVTINPDTQTKKIGQVQNNIAEIKKSVPTNTVSLDASVSTKNESVPKEDTKHKNPGEHFADCFRQELLKYQQSPNNECNQLFGQDCFKISIAKFLEKHFDIKVDETQIVIAASKEQLLQSILNLQSLNSPYIKTNGMGLLRLANQFSEGSLTTIKAVTAIAEETDLSIKKIFSSANLKTREIPLDNLEVAINFLITSGTTSAFIEADNNFENQFIDSDEQTVVILDWANKEAYRYIIEYDTEPLLKGIIPKRFKALDTNDKVIYINSFENLFPFGLKTSFAILPKQIYADYQQRYDFFECPVSIPEQLALSNFINNEGNL